MDTSAEQMIDEAEEIYGEPQAHVDPYTMQQQQMQMQMMPQQMALAAPDGWALRKVGPLPVWAWALIAAAGGGAAWFYFTRKKIEKNDSDDDDDQVTSSPEPEESKGRSSWGPSRSRVAEKIEKHLKTNGKAPNVTVYSDADEAKKFVKTPSPLVTIKPKTGAFETDEQLKKILSREGLYANKHEDGSIGLYPATSRRGREWEKYIDALRDEGQSV